MMKNTWNATFNCAWFKPVMSNQNALLG